MIEYLTQLWEYLKVQLSPLINNGLIALVIVLAGFIIGNIVGKAVSRFLRNVEVNDVVKKAVGLRVYIEEAISITVRYVIYVIFIIIAFNRLGITGILVQVVVTLLVIAVMFSIFLAVRDFLPNLVAGLRLHRAGRLKKGDKISVQGIEGKIMSMSLIDITVKTPIGDTIYIPCSMLNNTMLRKKK